MHYLGLRESGPLACCSRDQELQQNPQWEDFTGVLTLG